MADNGENELAKQYQELLCRLPGVINTSVVFSGPEIAELHVLADQNRSPKQIVRDIQSAMAAQYGVSIDHRVVSVAQIPADSAERPHRRLVFEEINISKNKERSSATVTLTDGETTFSGSSSALNDRLEINRMICQATLSAVESFLDQEIQLSVADVKIFDLSGERAVSVCIAAKSKKGVDRLLGSTFVGEDGESAVVKATMDALNRRISAV